MMYVCVFLTYIRYMSYVYIHTPLYICVYIYVYIPHFINAQQILVINDNIILPLGSDSYWSMHFICSLPKAGRASLPLRGSMGAGV